MGFDDDYLNFSCDVPKLPFGMQIAAPPGKRPHVMGVLPGYPADAAGVKKGDILIEVAGRPVNAATYFAAMQQALPPYGLRFKRPIPDEDRKEENEKDDDE